MKKYKIGYTQGTYDLFHIGHLNLLENAKKQCEYLIVGVNKDNLVKEYKNKIPIIPEEERKRIIEALSIVDEVILVDTLDKIEILKKKHFDIIFVGDDWKNNNRWLKTKEELKKYNIPVVFLPHTDGISTTIINKKIISHKSDLISIIIPIYKVEKYLAKCIESVLNQTYQNLEIILVDDGSPDNCPKICDEYAKKDNRIKVIHKKNGGISDARNIGIEMSTGKYLSLIYGDDYIDENMIEELYKDIIKTKADISMCSFYKVYPQKIEKLKINLSSKIIIGLEKYHTLYNDYSGVIKVAWNKLYNKNVFNKIRYPKGVIMEDAYVLTDILKTVDKISYIDKPLYYYVQREDSIMHQFNLKRLDSLLHYERKIQFCLDNKFNDILAQVKLQYIKALTNSIIPGLYSINEFNKAKELITKSKILAQEIQHENIFSNKDKIQIKLISISPTIYVKIKKIVRRIKNEN